MRRLLAIVLLACTALPGFAQTADTGVARGVRPDAAAEGSGEVRRLVVGSDVKIGETIATDARGLVQLLFADRTELVIGPRSRLVIEDYLVRNNGSAGKFAINALSGTFRFVSGQARRDRYDITTPSGSIAIRGTAFDFTVTSPGPTFVPGSNRVTTSVLLFDGAVRLCNNAGQCVILDEICDFGTYNATGSLTWDNDAETRAGFRPFFPHALDQSPLLAAFRVANARQCISPPPTTAGEVIGRGEDNGNNNSGRGSNTGPPGNTGTPGGSTTPGGNFNDSTLIP